MRKALRLSPGHPLVLEDIGRYLTEGGMWAQLLELAQLELGAAATVGMTREERALTHLRCGQIMEERLGELEGARKAYEDAIAAAPSFRPPRDRLERPSVEDDLAARRRQHAREHLQEARLAGPVLAQDGHDLARGDLGVEPRERGRGAVARLQAAGADPGAHGFLRSSHAKTGAPMAAVMAPRYSGVARRRTKRRTRRENFGR